MERPDELNRPSALPPSEAERLARLARIVPDVLWEWDLDASTCWWHDNVAAVLGYTPQEMEPGIAWWTSRLHPQDQARIVTGLQAFLLSSGGTWSDEFRFRKADGTYAVMAAHAVVTHDHHRVPRYLSGVMHDATNRRALQEQLRQSQKMETLGRLAGSVAHDFNNLLTIIGGYAQLLNNQLGSTCAHADAACQINKAAERASELTRHLLAFGRRQVFQPKPVSLNHLLADLVPMIERLLGAGVQCAFNLAPEVSLVEADRGQIEMALINLVMNARDAMPSGGRLTVETEDIDIRDTTYRGQAVTPGRYVRLTVIDTGHGMDQHTLAHIFEPFFTTKASDHGTGLGLSTAHGVVRQSGGYLFAVSEPGCGSAFTLLLPASADPAAAVLPPSPDPLVAGGNETILVVDDEPMIRRLIQDALQPHGYTVLCARHGIEALQTSLFHRGAIDLLLTNVVMPQVNGFEVAKQLAAERRRLKVLYMSGVATAAGLAGEIRQTGGAFLPKPFTLRLLAQRIREVLDG